MKVLVASVGGSPEGQAKGIQELSPDEVVFLVSQASVDKVPDIKRLCQGVTFQDRKVMVGDESDLAGCYQAARQALQLAARKAGRLENLWFDFTGGTKVMSAALVLAGGEVGARPVYVGGKERNKHGLGTVVTGTEEVIGQANPWDAFAIPQQRRAALLFNQGRIEAARETMVGVAQSAHSPRLREYASIAVDMMTFYEGWDAFKHRDAVTSLRQSQVIRRLSALATGAEDTTLQNLAASADEGRQFVDDLLKDSGGGKHPSSRMTSDLLANAHRRAAEGRFDDGVARLYRAVEMAAQARLWERYRLSTENVDETRVPRTARQAVEERLGAPPWENLGLDKSYTLLNALEDSLGQRFYEREGRLKSTLFARNHSILAHGVDPISAETCEVFRSLALDLLELSEADLPRFPLWPEEPEWLR